jgi:hypothetical protein
LADTFIHPSLDKTKSRESLLFPEGRSTRDVEGIVTPIHDSTKENV